MKVDLHRLNYILIPETREERERFRLGPGGRAVGRALRVYHRFTPEGRALAALTLLASLFVFDARRGESHVLWGALVGLFAASLLSARAYRSRDVAVRMLAPARVTVGQEATFTLALESRALRPVDSVRCEGPFLPWRARWTTRRAALSMLPPGKVARVELKARFFERGEERLGSFRVARLVPFGLLHGQAKEVSGTRLLVVPRVADVADIALPRARRHQPGGVALASATGESRDLAGVRPYRPGDPVRDLHARSWARTGYPVVREYQQEYFTRVGVVLDLDASGSSAERVEQVIEVAAGIVSRLTRGDDLVDLLAVGEDVHTLTLGRSLGSLDQALDLLACAPVARAPLDPEAMLAKLEPHLPRLSALVVVAARWSAAHRALTTSVERLGVGVRVVVISPEPTEEPDARLTKVDPARLERGEALSL